MTMRTARSRVPGVHEHSADLWIIRDYGLARVENLLAVYDLARKTLPANRGTPMSDILRSAVVFLHAVLEGSVRYIAGARLPEATEAVLNDIPLAGMGRATKFGLGSLVVHRGTSVNALLAASVEAHLARESFNSVTEILAMLQRCGVDTSKLRLRCAILDQMIQRRHKIVHEGDHVKDRKRWSQAPRELSRRQVEVWFRSVQDALSEMDDAFAPSMKGPSKEL